MFWLRRRAFLGALRALSPRRGADAPAPEAGPARPHGSAPGRPPERLDPAHELVDQLVRELGHEGVLPVVALLGVRRVEHVLLRDVRVRAHAVVDEAGRLAQPAQPGRIAVRAGVAGTDD